MKHTRTRTRTTARRNPTSARQGHALSGNITAVLRRARAVLVLAERLQQVSQSLEHAQLMRAFGLMQQVPDDRTLQRLQRERMDIWAAADASAEEITRLLGDGGAR